LSGLVLNCAVFGALYRPLESKKDPEELQRKLTMQGQQLKNTLSRMSFAISNAGGSELDVRPSSAFSRQVRIYLTHFVIFFVSIVANNILVFIFHLQGGPEVT
jgi:hypothetical protein